MSSPNGCPSHKARERHFHTSINVTSSFQSQHPPPTRASLDDPPDARGPREGVRVHHAAESRDDEQRPVARGGRVDREARPRFLWCRVGLAPPRRRCTNSFVSLLFATTVLSVFPSCRHSPSAPLEGHPWAVVAKSSGQKTEHSSHGQGTVSDGLTCAVFNFQKRPPANPFLYSGNILSRTVLLIIGTCEESPKRVFDLLFPGF